jgi:hypothetical protein
MIVEGIIMIRMLVVFLVGLACGVAWGAEPAVVREGSEAGAVVAANEWVRDCLKSPNDTAFEEVTAGKTDEVEGKRHWVVKGKVTAPDGSGAKLTHYYEAHVFYGDDKQWKLWEVKIDGKVIPGKAEKNAKVFQGLPARNWTLQKGEFPNGKAQVKATLVKVYEDGTVALAVKGEEEPIVIRPPLVLSKADLRYVLGVVRQKKK